MGVPKRMFIIIPRDGDVEQLRSLIPAKEATFVGDIPALDKKALVVMLSLVEAQRFKRILEELERARKAKVIDLLLLKNAKTEEGS